MATFPPIPLETAKAAQAIFGRSNFYLVVGDQAENLFAGFLQDDAPRTAWRSDWALAMFYLITIFQFVETLPDYLAADALHERVEWKYALHLPLSYLSLDAAEFCKFRQWLRASQAARQNLQTLLLRLSEETSFIWHLPGDLEAGQVISEVCSISRLGKIWEGLNQALEVLATRQPGWLLTNSLPHWYERYKHGARNLNVSAGSRVGYELARGIGADGYYLLEAISKSGDPELAELNEVRTLGRVWLDEFDRLGGKVLWKKEFCASCSSVDKLPPQLDGAGQEE
jgi:transposase